MLTDCQLFQGFRARIEHLLAGLPFFVKLQHKAVRSGDDQFAKMGDVESIPATEVMS